MLCQECNINDATIQFNVTINGVKTVRHLCPQCASKYGLGGVGMINTMSDMLSGLFALSGISIAGNTRETSSCKYCGYSLSQFERTGMLGCDRCYESFRQELSPLIKRVHGSVLNKPEDAGFTGQAKESELEKLKKQLDAAIKAEEYEKCAQLRDRIKELEKKDEK